MNYPGTFTITTQPFYDQYNQCYKNILMTNIEPEGPLRRLVRKIQLPRLSPFQDQGPCSNIPKCGLALTNLYNSNCNSNSICNGLMTPNEIPDLYSFLTANGYQIDTQLTNMMNQSEVKFTNSRLVCSATYYGNKQPNIVYMK